MNKIKLIFSSLAIIAVSALAPAMLIASSASAAPDPNPYNIKGQTCDGANGQPVKGGDGSCKSGADENTLPEIVAFIINVFSWIVGAVSVIMIIMVALDILLAVGIVTVLLRQKTLYFMPL